MLESPIMLASWLNARIELRSLDLCDQSENDDDLKVRVQSCSLDVRMACDGRRASDG